MKIKIGKVFSWPEPACYAFHIQGLGLFKCEIDPEDPPFACVFLEGKKLIKLKNIIEKEIDMKDKKVVPFNKREAKDDKKAFAKTEKTVKPVAKDTNKTRRKRTKPTKGQVK